MKIKNIMIILIIIVNLQVISSNYPEDYSSIELLTNPENKDNLIYDEVFLGAYYHTKNSAALPSIDYRNGIKIQPKDFSTMTSTTCDYSSGTYSSNDDNIWTYAQTSNIFYPSSLGLISYCIKSTQIILNLDSFVDSDIINTKYDLSYIFYFWIEKLNTNAITFSCDGSTGGRIFTSGVRGLYQFYLRYNYLTKTFSDFDNTSSFSCPSMKIKISIPGTPNMSFKLLKFTTLIPYEKIKNINCNDADVNGKCPPSYYCDINTGECKKCLGLFSQCQNRNIGLKCGRFTKEWQNTVVSQTSCTPDYYNLQNVGEMSFDITPPIKSNAASLSFWLFTLTDVNESSNVNDINPQIYHISLEDFFVVTIIPGKTKYIIYLTAYQMYHKAYGSDIQKLQTKNEFIEAIGEFPYIKWTKSFDINKMNRWINIIVSFNKNVPRMGIQIFYQKKNNAINPIINNNNINLDSEYIYNNNDNTVSSIQSTLHFKKFYRNSDTMHLNINIYNNGMGVFIRKAYVFATELITTSSNIFFGFQYNEYEKIFNNGNNLMPEFVLAVPLDKITKSETVNGQYSIEYYMYDMTKIYNNRVSKNLFVNPGDIDDSLYDYDPRLYRLNLLSEKNKQFSNPQLSISDNPYSNADDYFYYNTYNYACRLGYVVNPSTHQCTNTINSKILVPGINAGVNNRGTLTEVCYSKTSGTCISNSLTEFNCYSSLKFFDACLATPYTSNTIGYFYYSHFFKLPPIKINLNKIYKSYYIQFNFLYETNSALRPKEDFKGKKIYLFYTDAFRIWHDYSMKYLGIEDNQGNPSKNLITNFNLENENLFTISVTYDEDKNVYIGKLFLNGIKINAPPFTGEKLSYILFCHNDTACPSSNEIYWTSGFYNYIKIYDLEAFTVLNDNSFYSQYIYSNYYSHYNLENGNQRFDSYPMPSDSTEVIKMNIGSMTNYNYIGSYLITSYYANDDKIQMFNYGIDQTPSLRNYEDNKFINKIYFEDICPNSISCYGGSNIFSKESKVCDNSEYYLYDECHGFNASPKNKYYTLTLPLKENPTLERIEINLVTLSTAHSSRKVTFTLWIKLLGFKTSNKIFQTGKDSENRYCYLEYEEFDKISFTCIQSSRIIYNNYYKVPKKSYGKYMHLSISLSKHRNNTVLGFFVSFQINKKNVPNGVYSNLNTNSDFAIYIKTFYLYTKAYVQIAKFYVYAQVLIGGYAYNTNKYSEMIPKYKIVDDSKQNCLLKSYIESSSTSIYNTDYECINDFNPEFNDDYYIYGAYPDDKKVFLTQNNRIKVEECYENCGYFCYGTEENQCSCATNGYYDYIINNINTNTYSCKKLPSLDFKRYKSTKFKLPEIISDANGFDFWFYVTKGVNDYSSSRKIFSFRRNSRPVAIIDIYSNKVYYDWNYNYQLFLYNEEPQIFYKDSSAINIFNKWYHISCPFNSLSVNFDTLDFINEEEGITGQGIILIRQFRLWKDFNKKTNEMIYIEFIRNVNRDYIHLSIDSLINPDKSFSSYSSNSPLTYTTEDYDYKELCYGYSPIENEIQELELCSENEECKNMVNLNAIEDLTFENIMPSGTGRYTIEFWTKIKTMKYFLTGMNIVWKGLMSISILTDTLKDKLSVYCFPQDYLTSPFNYEGRQIINLAETALNKDSFDLDINNYDNVWFYTRCTYNWDNEIYYLKYDSNSVVPKDVLHETASFGTYKVDYPFKYLFNEYENYNFIIENASKNKDSEVYIRTLYLYNEYLPLEYDTQRILFTTEVKPIWLVFGVDFFNFNKVGDNLKIKYYQKSKEVGTIQEKEIESEIIKSKYQSRGGIILCDPTKFQKFNSDLNECEDPISTTPSNGEIKFNNNYYQCSSDRFLTFANINNDCLSKCPLRYNRGPGSLMHMDATTVKTALCNYKLSNYHFQYNDISDFPQNLICQNGYIRVGYKCLPRETQANSAVYFNRCYNFYPFFCKFDDMQNILLNGYIIEFSFKIDLVNDFCSDENDADDIYYFYAHPHAIIKNGDFYYRDTVLNTNIPTQKLEQISLYEWNHIIIEFNPKNYKINLYINYNMTQPSFSYTVDASNLNNYILKNILFCNGKELCEPLDVGIIKWGAAYYSKMRIYNLKYTSVYMVYENMRNKFKYEPDSTLVYYLFNTIDNDLNKFIDTISGKNLEFKANLPFVSVYRSDDNTLMFSSSSNFDYGQFHSGIFATSIEKITGKYEYSECFGGCKRCYSSKKNDCYECIDGYELFNKQCRQITGYYFQLPNYNDQEIEVKTDSILKTYNPITVTLWVKYHGIIRNSHYKQPISGKNCVLLMRFSTDDDIFICHEQEYNNLLMYKSNIILYNDTTFLEEQGKWQLVSVSNYKCNFNNQNTCNFYPSIFSFAINGKVVSRRSTYNIPENGVTLNKITFGYGIILTVADVNIYENFILNPLGIVSNFLSYQNYLIKSIKLYSTSSTDCIERQTLIASDGRDMYYQNDNNCFADYNLYHKLENYNCNDENKMINLNSIDNDCEECIDECKFCAGNSYLNCACYYNKNYWFRNEDNILYCQVVPYIDLNKYSDLQFNEIKYATSNEFAIEFWYFIYEYNENEINFYRQVISWENHIKIEISKYSNDLINIECFPINEKDDSVSTNDVSQRYFKWNHIICATDLNNRIYYLNEGKINNIIGEGVKQLNYSTYDNRRVSLRFQSYDNLGDKASHGVFLLKELRLWNFFSIREFDSSCFYNYEWSKNNNIPNILHYFPFKMNKDEIISDVKGNLPSQIILKNTLIGYNIIDYENKYNIDEKMEECLIIYTIPEKVYFNLTDVLIYNYEINPQIYPFYEYKYEYYISQKGQILHNDITKIELNSENNPRELLLSKFKDRKYNGVQLNIYITLTEIDSRKVHYGFNIIKINSYYPGYDIDFETYSIGLQDNLEVDLDNLSNKYYFTKDEIWNRLNLLQSLGDIHNMALNQGNRTTTFLDYIYNETAISYQPDNIIIKDPVCYDNFCSGKGKCLIVVRSMVCLCNEGYSGRNCHLTTKNKIYLSESHLKMWNYLTNNNEYSTIPSSTICDYEFLRQLTFLIKSSTQFDDSYNEIINNFFDYINYLKQNCLSFVLEQINLIYETISFILINLYYDIGQFRAKNFIASGKTDYKNDEKIEEVNLNNEQINLIYDVSYKLTNIIPELILILIKTNKKDMFVNYTAFDYTIKSVSHSFDYMEYFNNLHINNRDKYNSYLPFIDAYKCADYIFGSTGYSTIFLVIINYHYDPLSYHSVYSNSASYSIDVFYATQIGTKLDVKACPNYINIYFPLTLYNTSEIEFINSHAKFLSESSNFTIKDPYVTWPVYVHKNGSVSNKTRYERINEVLPMIKIDCSYYNDKLSLLSNISSTIVSENFYLICQTNHLSLYTIQSESSGLDYKMAGIFFYLEAPQVFICGKNWGNGCSILLLISLLLFAFFIILFKLLEKTLMITKNSLNNIKLEILKENRLIYDELDLIGEITKANKMNEQENMAKNLKIQLENDKYDKDLKQNLYLYGTKNIDYNDQAFEGGEIGEELDEGYGGKGVFSNPPKKKGNGFIIDDLDDIDDISSLDDKDSIEKETKLKKSINILNKKKLKQRNKLKIKQKIQDYKSENKTKEDNNMRFYKVREYNPEKTNDINQYNYNLYKESDFGFNESENSEDDYNNKTTQNNKKKSKAVKFDASSVKESEDRLEGDEKDSEKNEKKKKAKDKKDKKGNKKEQKGKENKLKNEEEKNEEKKINELNNIQYNDDEDDENSEKNKNYDYFSKYKSVIKNENKNSKKVNIQKGNYTIVDKYRKVTFVKERYYSLDIPSFFEHIDIKNPSIIKLFWHLFLRRNVYISPFIVSSTINPRWKRILCLYIYLLLQILICTFGLSIAERININKGAKLFIFQFINILLADIIVIIIIPLFRIPTVYKKMLFLNFRSTQQMKLIKVFKTVKEIQKKKYPFIIAIISSIFIITFYLSFNYCSVLYYSRWLFIECVFLGILLDFVIYEGLLNALICLLYFAKGKKKFFINPYVYLFLFRNYRTCF